MRATIISNSISSFETQLECRESISRYIAINQTRFVAQTKSQLALFTKIKRVKRFTLCNNVIGSCPSFLTSLYKAVRFYYKYTSSRSIHQDFMNESWRARAATHESACKKTKEIIAIIKKEKRSKLARCVM